MCGKSICELYSVRGFRNEKTTIKRMNWFNASEYFIGRSDAINQSLCLLLSWWMHTASRIWCAQDVTQRTDTRQRPSNLWESMDPQSDRTNICMPIYRGVFELLLLLLFSDQRQTACQSCRFILNKRCIPTATETIKMHQPSEYGQL